LILIVGATGLLGGMITQQLLAQGKEVRILVRHNSPSEGLAHQFRHDHSIHDDAFRIVAAIVNRRTRVRLAAANV
jgi:uncharacterized protein YbjT (DUF2867 family)